MFLGCASSLTARRDSSLTFGRFCSDLTVATQRPSCTFSWGPQVSAQMRCILAATARRASSVGVSTERVIFAARLNARSASIAFMPQRAVDRTRIAADAL
jgi:hypothetical protein